MSSTPIKDEKGKVIGYKTSDNTYLKPSGEVVARIRNETTLDKKGATRGKGDQALKLF